MFFIFCTVHRHYVAARIVGPEEQHNATGTGTEYVPAHARATIGTSDLGISLLAAVRILLDGTPKLRSKLKMFFDLNRSIGLFPNQTSLGQSSWKLLPMLGGSIGL